MSPQRPLRQDSFLEILVLKVGLAKSDPCNGRVGAGADEEVSSWFTVLLGLCQMFSAGSVPRGAQDIQTLLVWSASPPVS